MGNKLIWVIENTNSKERETVAIFTTKEAALEAITFWSHIGPEKIYNVNTDISEMHLRDCNEYVHIELDTESVAKIRVLYVKKYNLDNGAGLSLIK